MIRLLVVAILVGCGTDTRHESVGVEPALEPAALPTAVKRRGGSDAEGYIGVLTPKRSAEVAAPFESTVTEISVNLGDEVDKGHVLGRIDDRPLREELSIAQATLKAKQAEAAQAAIDHRAATTALERERRAYKDSVASMAQVNTAEFNERKAAMAVARSAASVDEQLAKLAQLRARLVDTTLLAPLAGEVALIYLQPGDHVEEGHPIIRVISSNELFVKFAIPADKAGTLAVGAMVDVALEQQGMRAQAVVRHVAPELDPTAQMIVADADLVEPPTQLQSGMVCRIVPRSTRIPSVSHTAE